MLDRKGCIVLTKPIAAHEHMWQRIQSCSLQTSTDRLAKQSFLSWFQSESMMLEDHDRVETLSLKRINVREDEAADWKREEALLPQSADKQIDHLP